MKIDIASLALKTDREITEDAAKLRGFISSKFNEHSILHNHSIGNSYVYSYPLIQYKIINGQAYILGIEDGAETLKQISNDIDVLKLAKNTYEVNKRILHEREFDIKPSSQEKYEFLSPWLAFNPKNFEMFNSLNDWKDKKIFLNRILVGNILSMAKGLGIIVNRRLFAHSHLDAEFVKFKSVNVQGFIGEFKVNFDLPDYFGLGKGVSQGFGVVKKIKE